MRRKKRILLLNIESHYGHRVVEGVDAYCRSHGSWEYRFGRDQSKETLRQARVAVQQWKATGIIVCIQHDALTRFVKNSRLPTVNVTAEWNVNLPSIYSDNMAIGRMVARHFLDRGLRNFAFCPVTPSVPSHRRCEGFCSAVAEAGFTCSVFTDQYTGKSDVAWVRNQRRMNRWLISLKKPVGMMITFDARALEIISTCHDLGIRVPDEVAVVGVGDQKPYNRLSTPQISTVAPDLHRIGYEAARMLDGLIRGEPAPRAPLLIPPLRLIERQSSDIIAVEDPDIAASVRYIRDHGHELIGVKHLLREVPISRRTLERRFMELFGHTPKEEISRVRLERAKRLLEETDETVPRVAKASGFAGPASFFDFFRERTGTTPTKYRSQSRQQGRG